MSKWSEALLSPQFVGGAVGAVGNIVSTLATNASNRALQREANEFNRQMWLEQTEYNTPVNQVARLKQAGLNPNLANGEPNQAGAPPEYRSSKNEAPQVDPMMIANAMLLKSQQEANDAASLASSAEARKLNADAENQEILNEDARDKIEREKQSWKSNLDEQEKRIDILGENLRGIKFDNDLKEELRDITIEMQEVGLISQYFDIGETYAKIQSLYQGINESIKRGELIDEQKLTEIAKRNGIELDNLIKVAENGKRITMATLVLKSINGEPLTTEEEDSLEDWLETEYDQRKYGWQIPFYSGLNGLLIQDDILGNLKERDKKRKQEREQEKKIKQEEKQVKRGLKEYDSKGKGWRRYPNMNRQRLKLLLNLL